MIELYKKDVLIVFQIVTNMLRMYGYILLVPLIVSLFFKEFYFSAIFAVMSLFTVSIFSLIKLFLKQEECKTKHAIISLALGWIIISLVSSIPFLLYRMDFINALFEAFSGWTGTGLTMIENPSIIPGTLNFFRGFIQWVGGFGIVILALLLYERPKTAQALFLAEGRFEDFYVNLSKIARIIVVVYSIYTVMGILLFIATGVPILDAIVHALSTIATGGYSSNGIGIGIYGKIPMFIAILLMYIGGISFLTHYKTMKEGFHKLFSNPEVKFMFGLTAIATIVVGFDLYKAHKSTFYDGFFYVISALTGTGAGTPINVNSFPAVSIFVFILLMICGATYGSTSGALKIWRIMVVLKNIKREITKYFYPQGTVLHIKMGNHIITDEESSKVGTYIFLYLAILAIGSIIFIFAGYNTLDSLFLISSAQGNVGLSTITENYFNMNPLLKLQLMFHMLLGRLEILPFIAMIRSLTMVRRYK